MTTRRRVVAAVLAGAVTSLVPLAAQSTPARDTVRLDNGSEVRGRVLRVDAKVVVVRVGSVDRTIRRDQVQSFTSVASHHRELMARWRDTATTDATALLALATTAEQQDLPHEAKLLRWYAVLLRPEDAAIHAALGNREQGGRFRVEIDGKWVPFADADALGEDFDDAWKLRSEHFTIRCAAGLRTGLDTLMELEALYWRFHDLFGPSLQLLELVEPIDVRLYRTRKQMPNVSNNVGAYFSRSEPALFTCVENGRPCALVHEATHGLLYHFFVRAAKARGDLPGWLDEGWAEYIDGLAQARVPGKPTFLERSTKPGHLQTLAAARQQDDLYGVHRLLNFKSSDFGASSHQDTKYAQAWALFRYLFEHPDDALRAQFVDYLQQAAAGKGQASSFRRIFARQERQLETEPWQ
ncbi:MAG: DUF1570 domain-containing protein [Planctomycetes bacterium]|nr:DUF1570 domain-containing protein [Planctomycetota bacterium]